MGSFCLFSGKSQFIHIFPDDMSKQAFIFRTPHIKAAAFQTCFSLEVIQFAAGSAEKVLDHWKFDEADLEHIIQIENKHDSGNLSFSIQTCF